MHGNVTQTSPIATHIKFDCAPNQLSLVTKPRLHRTRPLGGSTGVTIMADADSTVPDEVPEDHRTEQEDRAEDSGRCLLVIALGTYYKSI